MSKDALTAVDRRQIESHGLSVEEVARQLGRYAHPPTYTRLARPCVPGDGIRKLEPAEAERLRAGYDRAVLDRKAVKFVPASGAATRMFKTALQWLDSSAPVSSDSLRRKAAAGERAAAELETLLEGLPDMALWEALAAAMRRDGHDPLAALRGADIRVVLDHLLTRRGLGCAELPKALLPFHRYDGEVRTPLEEHLVEAAQYVRDGMSRCRLHFTVSAEHLEACTELVQRASMKYGRRFGVTYEVGFSLQKPSTDTVAVDDELRPFRDSDGRLLLRPAGHGALIENLAELDADVVFIKNIDNVVPDRLKETVHAWKRTLGGLLIELQSGVFAHLEALETAGDERAVGDAIGFLESELGAPVASLLAVTPEERRRRVVEILDRPLRVCGMVLNRGEPGGGPFWAGDRDQETKQIVEPPQVDPRSAEQQELLRSATHFSPVDLVCSLRDRRGDRYDLRRYVDQDACLIVEKSHGGRPLRSLECPGLWNGGMAHWNTTFVEVPLETFAPVKTINDLLRPEHRGA
jgi:hypothetical protein